MAIELQHSGGTIILSPDLTWVDEYEYSPIAQSREHATSGSMIVQEGTRLAGRPITLAGHNRRVWATKSELDALRALLVEGSTFTLTLHDARSFSVIWDHANNKPIETGGTVPAGLSDPIAETPYELRSLRFIEV